MLFCQYKTLPVLIQNAAHWNTNSHSRIQNVRTKKWCSITTIIDQHRPSYDTCTVCAKSDVEKTGLAHITGCTKCGGKKNKAVSEKWLYNKMQNIKYNVVIALSYSWFPKQASSQSKVYTMQCILSKLFYLLYSMHCIVLNALYSVHCI